jgi:hypothetical protein
VKTCLNSNNGQITIVAQELFAYTATLSNDDFFQEYNFTNDVDIFNLLAGTYTLCISIEEWPDYEVCYTVVITQPDPLTVFSSRVASSKELVLNMTGSTEYHIELNGESISTTNNYLVLQLQDGENQLSVKTDLECQGKYEERIVVSDDILVFPNPVKEIMSIFNPSEDEDIQIRIYSINGKLLMSKLVDNRSSIISIDMTDVTSGVYLLNIISSSGSSTQKIIKE